MTHPLTIIVTSCDRFDLLERTLDSFFALNKYPYVAFHVHNDSLNPVPDFLKQKCISRNITWHEGTKRGLSASWDYLVNLVETEYFLNLEDDFEFFGNPNFIEESIKLLERFHQVWIRDESDHNHRIKHGFENELCNRVVPNETWCGFTFNPSIRQLSRWKIWFPNGVTGKDEIDISRSLYPYYKAVSLKNSSIRHIGGGRHSNNFKI